MSIKLIVPTEGFQLFPKLNESFRIGLMVGQCEEHILNEQGYCTHIKVRDASFGFGDELSDSELRIRLEAYGVAECPHVKDEFCNIQFEDGSHCEGCMTKLEYANRMFVQTQAKFKCPLMKDSRISVCWEGCNLEYTYLRDKCIACCEEAADKRGWESSSRALRYEDVNKELFRIICETFITYLEVKLDCGIVFEDGAEDEFYVVDDYRIFVDMMTIASWKLGFPLDVSTLPVSKELKRAIESYKSIG